MRQKASAMNRQPQTDRDSAHGHQWWIGRLSLLKEDREVLLNGKGLTGSIINAAQAILSRAHPHIGGFQDTALGTNLGFKPVDPNRLNVQILHTGSHSCSMHL